MGADAGYSKGLGTAEDNAHVINDHESGSHRPKGFGLCDSCDHIAYSRTKYGTEVTFCSASSNEPHHVVRPNRFDPIVRCVWYDEFGKMSLAMMWNIATLIDVKKAKMGFGLEGEAVQVLTEKLNPKDRLNRWHFSD